MSEGFFGLVLKYFNAKEGTVPNLSFNFCLKCTQNWQYCKKNPPLPPSHPLALPQERD